MELVQVRRADVLSDDELVAELRRRGRELMDVEPVSWPAVIGWLRAEAAGAAADPEWAGGQDHPDALDRVADQLDELLTAAEVYVEHVRNAGGGQVPGPGTSKLEALEAAIDPGSGVPRGTPVREDAGFSTGDEAPRVCVAVRGGRWRNEPCGDPVELGVEGDLCPRHQGDAAAIGRQVIGLLRTIRKAERGAE